MQTRLTIIALVVMVIGGACQPAAPTAPLSAAPPNPTPASTSAAAPSPSATLEPQPTPRPRGTTVVLSPPATIPADWKKFVSADADIWLPSTYVGGDVGIPFMMETFKTLGPAFQQSAMLVEHDVFKPFMYMQNSQLPASRIVTEVEVAKLADLTLDDLGAKLDAGLPEGPTSIVEWGNVTLRGRKGIRLVQSSIQSPISTVNILSYFLEDGDAIYYIGYTSGEEEFPALLPDFEQSAGSFTLK